MRTNFFSHDIQTKHTQFVIVVVDDHHTLLVKNIDGYFTEIFIIRYSHGQLKWDLFLELFVAGNGWNFVYLRIDL